MVVGNGMIAKAFESFKDNNDVIIFASGVSNSKETNPEEYYRELKLLTSYTNMQDKKLIYFSTCSIFDSDLEWNPYIKHKIEMEKFIRENFKNYIIFRLPNVIGRTENPNTFFNYFKNKIANNEEIIIKRNAVRFLIDMDDVSDLVPLIIERPINNCKTFNIAYNNKRSVYEIAHLMAFVMNKKLNYKFVDGGVDYQLDNIGFVNFAKERKKDKNKFYIKYILTKYLN